MTDAGVNRVWELMESIRFCMLTNWDGEQIHARPMGAFVRRDEGLVYFFTDVRAGKDHEIARHPRVCLAFADTKSQDYVSVSGTAEISSDRRKIQELWAIPAKLWFETPDNPNIRLIKFRPERAEYWDAPGNLISSLKVAFAIATGAHVHYGDHEKTQM
jgi:general stress protein 26